MARAYTMKSRMQAILRGEMPDRVPFVQYPNLGGPNEEAWRLIGRDHLGLSGFSSVTSLVAPHCKFHTESVEKDGIQGERTTLATPKGILVEEKYISPALRSRCIRKHYISEPADYEVFMSYLGDIRVVTDTAAYEKRLEVLGDNGFPMINAGRTPYQQLWICWVSIEDLAIHMLDNPDIVESCADLLADIQRRVFDAIYEAAGRVEIHLVNIPDNITAGMIGDRLFRRYNAPLYRRLCEIMDRRGIPVVVHMDGALLPLRHEIAASPIRGLESFTPTPDNDTSVAEAVSLWPDKRLLVNFPSSVHLAPAEAIYREAMEILRQGGQTGRLWIQISENMPPEAWKKSYPAIDQAIMDFQAAGHS